MSDGVQLGSMFWKLGLRGTLKQDVAAAEKEIDGLEQKTTRATGTTNDYSDSVLKSQLNTILFGTSLVAASSAISTGATVLSRLNMISSDTADIMRVTSTGLGMVAAAAMGWTQIQQFASMIGGKLVGALHSVTVAATTAAGAMTLLGGATAIGLVVVGAVMLYNEFEKAASGAKDLERAMDTLQKETDGLRYMQTAYNDQLQDAEKRYDSLTEKVKEYDKAIQKVNDGLERSKTIDKDIADTNLAIEGAVLDVADARNAMVKAAESGDPGEIKRARYNLKVAQDRERDLRTKRESLDAEKEALPTAQQLAALYAQKRMDAAKQLEAEKETLRLTKLKQAAEDQIRTNDFAMKMMEWGKAGIPITQEQRNLWSQVPWMKKAMDLIPQDIWRYPDVKGTREMAMSTMAVPGQQGIGMGLAAQYIYAGGLSSKQIKNPFWGDTTAPVDASLKIEKIEVRTPSEIGPAVDSLTSSQKNRIDLARNGVSLGW